ncbi:replicative DNA helicase [Caminicella sporogenes]|uniref:replicative DNA helicase n=1 Tax=Caminicella sporogenes TaxID=166485 RepID=UPI0025410B99|nr:replicative DNA helicase [Caminicella sporogenes]WIF95043.1 replicative DNA helicase [Caminicella sporogenes]
MICNIELEQSILACLLISEDCAVDVDRLFDEDFTDKAHKEILRAIKNLIHKKEKVDYLTTYNELEQRIELSYLIDLSNSLPGVRNFNNYVKDLKKLTYRRKILKLADDLKNKTLNNDDDLQEFAEREIMAIGEEGVDDDFSTPCEIVMTVLDEIEKKVQEDEQFGLMTGFEEIDRMTDGFKNGDLIYLAARPSMGKTALAINIAQNVAYQGKIVVMFSLEMTKKQYIRRMLLSEAIVPELYIRNKKLENEHWTKLTKSASKLYRTNIHISDKNGQTVAEMLSKCRRLKRKKGRIDLVIIDYLQYIASNFNGSRREQLEEISKSLKGMAKELNCPVICISSLSRACEQRPNKRPMLSDLRETGQIEYDADVVMFIYRDEYYNPEEAVPGEAEIIFAKQRNGPTGTVKLGFISECTKFVDYKFLKRG